MMDVKKAKVMANLEHPWDEMVLRCAAGCDDFMVFGVENIALPDEKNPDWWIEVSLTAEMRPQTFGSFLRAVWQLFRYGRWHRASADFSRHTLIQLRDWCQYALDKIEKEENPQ